MAILNIQQLNRCHHELIQILNVTQHDHDQSEKLTDIALKSPFHAFAALSDWVIVASIKKDCDGLPYIRDIACAFPEASLFCLQSDYLIDSLASYPGFGIQLIRDIACSSEKAGVFFLQNKHLVELVAVHPFCGIHWIEEIVCAFEETELLFLQSEYLVALVTDRAISGVVLVKEIACAFPKGANTFLYKDKQVEKVKTRQHGIMFINEIIEKALEQPSLFISYMKQRLIKKKQLNDIAFLKVMNQENLMQIEPIIQGIAILKEKIDQDQNLKRLSFDTRMYFFVNPNNTFLDVIDMFYHFKFKLVTQISLKNEQCALLNLPEEIISLILSYVVIKTSIFSLNPIVYSFSSPHENHCANTIRLSN